MQGSCCCSLCIGLRQCIYVLTFRYLGETVSPKGNVAHLLHRALGQHNRTSFETDPKLVDVNWTNDNDTDQYNYQIGSLIHNRMQ